MKGILKENRKSSSTGVGVAARAAPEDERQLVVRFSAMEQSNYNYT